MPQDSNHPTPAPHRNAIALDYKDIIRIALAHGYEPKPEVAMAAFARVGEGLLNHRFQYLLTHPTTSISYNSALAGRN
jgi:hypothetical protein